MLQSLFINLLARHSITIESSQQKHRLPKKKRTQVFGPPLIKFSFIAQLQKVSQEEKKNNLQTLPVKSTHYLVWNKLHILLETCYSNG